MAVKFGNGIDLSNQRAINVADPSLATDAVNKQYADALVRGLSWKVAVRAATTAAATLSTAYTNGQTLDGIVLVTNDRILIKNQSTGSENGIYVVQSSGAPLRALDADASTEIAGATVTVLQGSVNGDKVFRLVTDSVTLGTTALVFTEVGGGSAGTTYAAGAGLAELPAGTFNVSAGDGISVATGTVSLASTVAGAGLTYTNGVINAVAGSGIVVTADSIAIDPSVVARKLSASIGTGSATSVVVTHNLGTRDVSVSVYDNASPYAEIFTDVEHTDVNTVTLRFATAPSSGQFRVVVVG
ncbi:hypothetical protein [Streptosporangium subroseum]|uniref:hypothetical protein n=1 Tax=Streptosporangium subroseum TaxID=106412 RepID=UPI003086AFD9|nr:hypothetical protein OHB15_14075 [Streptosporangium subroseum]